VPDSCLFLLLWPVRQVRKTEFSKNIIEIFERDVNIVLYELILMTSDLFSDYNGKIQVVSCAASIVLENS